MFAYWEAKAAMNRIYTSSLGIFTNCGYNGQKAGYGNASIPWAGWPLSCMIQKDL